MDMKLHVLLALAIFHAVPLIGVAQTGNPTTVERATVRRELLEAQMKFNR